MRLTQTIWHSYRAWCLRADECAVVVSPVLMLLFGFFWYGIEFVLRDSALAPPVWLRQTVILATVLSTLHCCLVLGGWRRLVPSHRRFQGFGSLLIAACCFTPVFFLCQYTPHKLGQIIWGIYFFGTVSGIQLGFIFLTIAARAAARPEVGKTD